MLSPRYDKPGRRKEAALRKSPGRREAVTKLRTDELEPEPQPSTPTLRRFSWES